MFGGLSACGGKTALHMMRASCTRLLFYNMFSKFGTVAIGHILRVITTNFFSCGPLVGC